MTNKQKYTILFILGALSALGPLSIDMYLPAFPSIATSLYTDISKVGLSLTSYFIGISVGQLFYGPITDKYGRKKPLLFGLIVFLLASIGCSFSPTINWLIVMRVFLALGGCVGMVVGRAVVRDLFPATETAKIFSMLMLITGVAPILAPSLGGWILKEGTWHDIFYVLTGFSAVMIIAVFFLLPESRKPDKTISLALDVVLKNYRTVLMEPRFIYYALASSIAMGGLFAYISGASFVFMKYFKLTEIQFGWVFGMNAFGYISGGQLNRLLLNRFKAYQVINKIVYLLLIVSLILISLLAMGLLYKEVLIAMIFLFLFSLGLLAPNATALALSPFKELAGSASALIGFIQMFCGAGISMLVSFLHNKTLFPMVFSMFLCGISGFGIIMLYKIKAKREHVQNV